MGKGEKMLVTSIFPFSHNVFTRLLPQGLFDKDLNETVGGKNLR